MKYIFLGALFLSINATAAIPNSVVIKYDNNNSIIDYSQAAWKNEIIGIELSSCDATEDVVGAKCKPVSLMRPTANGVINIDQTGLWRLDFYKTIDKSIFGNIKIKYVWNQYVIAMGSPNNATISAANKYKPTLSFHDEEEYYPVSVEALFDRPFGNIIKSELINKDSYIDKIDYRVDTVADFISKNGNLNNKIEIDPAATINIHGDKNNFPIYWYHQTKGTSTWITYFMLYGYDKKYDKYIGIGAFGGFGNHSIDRESVTIEFSNDTTELIPKKITYGHHLPSQSTTFLGCDGLVSCSFRGTLSISWAGGKTSVLWDNASKIGDSPIIYIGHGSHAVMPGFGWFFTDATLANVNWLTKVVEPAGSYNASNLYTPAKLENIDLNNKNHSALSFSGYLINGAAEWYRIFPFTRYPMDNWTKTSGLDFNDCIAAKKGCEHYVFNLPKIISVSPLSINTSADVIFTINGFNLSDGMGFAVDDCSPSSNELPGGSVNQRRFRCTINGVPGQKHGEIKNKPGGDSLYKFTAAATIGTSNTWISTITPPGYVVKSIINTDLSKLPDGNFSTSGKYIINFDLIGCNLNQELLVSGTKYNGQYEIITKATSPQTKCSDGSHTASIGYTELYTGAIDRGVLFVTNKSACSFSLNNICYNYSSYSPLIN